VEEYVKTMFANSEGVFDDSVAAEYGYETAQEMYDSFYKAFTSGTTTWDSIDIPSDLINVDKLSITAADKLSKLFHNINLGPAGKEAGKTFTDGLNTMLAEVNPED
jgi:hypothetical protein